MNEMTIRAARKPLLRELCAWQRATFGFFALSLLINLVQTARIGRLESARRETAARLEQAERTRDAALGAGEACPQGSEGAAQDLEKLGKLALQAEWDKQARTEQTAAFEAAGAYTYVGECTITAYCPCEACCGQWADGLTATGLPAEPGIVAVDPEVIPLGSTVVIDGQRYLAADTGVTGQAVDLCLASHQAAEAFGVRTADVWVCRE